MTSPEPLHLANGQATAARLADAGIAGRILDIDDVLHEGPVRDGLGNDAAWRERAIWMEREHEIDAAAYLAKRRAIARALHEADGPVTLWSEECLHCAVNLLHTLTLPTRAPLRLVSPTARLAESSPEALRKAHDASTPLSAARIALARATWSEYAAPTPEGLARRVDGLAQEWPTMARLLRLHFERLPDARTGLGRVERHVLAAALAHHTLTDAFRDFNTAPATRDHGLGDTSYRHIARRLATAGLVTLDGHELRATPTGRAVHEGREVARLAPRWIGGVRA